MEKNLFDVCEKLGLNKSVRKFSSCTQSTSLLHVIRMKMYAFEVQEVDYLLKQTCKKFTLLDATIREKTVFVPLF